MSRHGDVEETRRTSKVPHKSKYSTGSRFKVKILKVNNIYAQHFNIHLFTPNYACSRLQVIGLSRS